MRPFIRNLGVAALAALAFTGCEGSGTSGGGLDVRSEPIAANCTPAGGDFPSGLAVLSRDVALATLVQPQPPGIAVYSLDSERPIRLLFDNIGTDSDADGVADTDAIRPVLGFPLSPLMGEIQALRDDLALVSTSNYEQVLVYDPSSATPVEVRVEVPASVPAGRYPLLPAPGTADFRTGVSTLVCVSPPDPTDSGGGAIGADCDPGLPSYFTNLTAGKAVAAGRLFVATSNLVPGGGDRFLPGSVLVYEWSEAGGQITVRPDPDAPVLFTTSFNPTGMIRFVTPAGRELVLVTATGAIGQGSGSANVLTQAAIDVIDPSVPRIAARIPLGLAGPSFDAPAIDPSRSVAWIGATSERQLYAVDLRALDAPGLYASADAPPVPLDGTAPPFPDARIFTGDLPFALPDRAGGPPSRDCDGFTRVAVNASGSEVYATDFCDGTLTRVRLDLGGSPPIPYSTDRFELADQSAPFAPNDALGELRSPGVVAVRPGTPVLDYSSPDVLVVARTGPPVEGQLCALRVQSF